MERPEPLLRVSNLSTRFNTEAGIVNAVDGVNLTVSEGEVLGLVGESGSGKSVTALSIMRLVGKPGEIVAGDIDFDGTAVLKLSDEEMIRVRGDAMAMIFQQPQSSLNPVHMVGKQVAEVFELHTDLARDLTNKRTIELFRRVGIPDPEARVRAYPHELSGGQAQRVMIAMALALSPRLLIADEPTTALDVTVQAQVLELISDLTRREGMAVLLITHDLGVVAEMADRVAVMYAGQIVEEADSESLFDKPLHPYTAGLLRSMPVLGEVGDRLETIQGTVPNLIDLGDGCHFANRCEARIERDMPECLTDDPELQTVSPGRQVRCWLYDDKYSSSGSCLSSSGSGAGASASAASSEIDERDLGDEGIQQATALVEVDNLVKYYPIRGGVLRRTVAEVKAVDDVSFSIRGGETLGLVGESGCGKSTIGRTLLRLNSITSGSVRFEGREVFGLDKADLAELRKDMQIILQDPYASLNPRRRIGLSIADGLAVHGIGTKAEQRDMVAEILREVGLEPDYARRYPHEFSGGQRQRIGIARALVLRPKLVVCDEPVSALDVSVQSQVLNLLDDVQSEFDLTYLFIAHNLAVVEHISDRLAIMYLGKVVELADSRELFDNPLHPYTQSLIDAVPLPDPTRVRTKPPLRGEVPSPIDPPRGCRFHTRCPIAVSQCQESEPPVDDKAPGHAVACWLV